MAFGVVTFVTLPLLDRLFVPYFLKINPIEATPIEFTMVKVEEITGNNSNKPSKRLSDEANHLHSQKSLAYLVARHVKSHDAPLAYQNSHSRDGVDPGIPASLCSRWD